MSALVILVTTIDDEEKARALARAALSAKLAACVQIHPIRSHYVWKDEMREEPEFLLHMKARGDDYPALAELVRRLHSYETPEILRVDVAEADKDYLAWAMEATRR
ncbi:divalent-cation tolerance protein CutA [Methylocystis sp.]|uniref:divalent-cation tolerance protein CutA n=1 Tax=Methylocystis sp. TaxID=1911079 RepID=UPI0027332927|nr:divalent-cation tolerance protein CutA [Methylocystis sp.]MDP3555076.1 divalent-cation tolerance protein CutA [Methylocystis sp.]